MMQLFLLNQLVSNIGFDSIVAALALGVSVLSLGFSLLAFYQEKKMNITNLQAVYFSEIFREYIIEKIPDAVSLLHFEGYKLSSSYKNLNNIMMDMLKSAKYYAYAKHDFYITLKEKVQTLEDKLIICSSKEVKSKDEQMEFIYSVHQDVKKIVIYINQNYHKF